MKKLLKGIHKKTKNIKSIESFYLLYTLWLNLLTCSGGFLNTLGIIIFGDSISHFSGNISRLAIEYENFNYLHADRIVHLLISYFLGAVLSGIILNSQEFSFRHRYGIIIMVIGATILGLYLLFYNTLIFEYSLPFLLGVQNGLFISYKGIIVRTTHITGNLTDAGVYLGRVIRGERQDSWRILFYFKKSLY